MAEALNLASERALGHKLGRTIREKRTANGQDFWASFVCFRLTGPPTFLPESHLEEKSYGFLLLLEIQVNAAWFLGVFKHQAASLTEWLEAKARPLHRGKLTNAFSDGSAVSKMSLQRLAPSKHELRAASYEAADLQSSLPMIAASRCAIRSIRFQDSEIGSIGVTVSTSRVQRSGGRRPIDGLVALVAMVATETLADKRHPFLATFAQAVRISDLPAGARPTSVLFDWAGILETDGLELHKKPDPGDGLGEQVSKRLLNRLLGDVLPVVVDGDGWRFGRTPNQSRGTFGLTSTKFSVKAILGNRLVVHDVQTDEILPLARWARDNDAYSITFTDSRYFFGGGALYHRAAFANEVDIVRRCLRAEASLASATSEKGKPRRSATQFPANSIFGVVEDSIYVNRNWLSCIDLGDEWADYLCVRGSALLFVHCKGGSPTTGASSFQEVVGQALKNLGRIRSTPSDFKAKLAATKRRRFWAGTRIERLLRMLGGHGTGSRLPSSTFSATPMPPKRSTWW